MTPRTIAFALAAALLAAPALARMEALVRDVEVDEGATLMLVVRVGGANLATPDFDPLKVDFEIVSNNPSTEFSSAAGPVEATRIWTLRLRPKRTGTLEIPALRAGAEASDPLPVRVRAVTGSARERLQTAAFFEIEAPASVYVQAEIRLVRRLFYSDRTQLYGDMPTLPAIDEAVVVAVGDTEAFSSERDGTRYSVLEQTFAVFPQRSGPLTLPGSAVTASVRLGGRPVRHRVVAPPVDVFVKPIPAEYPANRPWFPATRVILEQTWAPEGRFSVGETVTRTIRLHAYGNVGSGIPPFDVRLPKDFKAYPDPPEHRDRQRDRRIVGIRTEAYALIPTQGGNRVIPRIEVSWWNVARDRLETTFLEAEHIEVAGTGPIDRPPAPTPAAPSPALPQAPPVARVAAPWVLAIAASGWLAAAAIWLRQRRRNRPDRTPPPSRTSPEALLASCRGAGPTAVKAALVDWLANHWGVAPATALRRLAQRPDGRQLLATLNADVYGRGSAAGTAQASVSATLLKAVLTVAETVAAEEANLREHPGTGLPPLYAR